MKKVFGKNKGNKIGAPVGSAEYGKFIREAYMDTVSEAVVLSDDLHESLSRYDEIVDSISKLKSEKDIIEHSIMTLMKENEIAYVKNRKITWKKSVRTSLDTKSLKEEEPEIYKKYSKISSSRMFKIR
ncbi:MAG: hypothetical protein E6371_02225 [Terrisporobacter othiniensis]|uniref:Uncharacterized protein n=1 Tax=Terrisporobacter othiniensis TaxID=1577792 RepID=A0A0B3VYB7_9FIRM|nr:hypothetical protein [Terrisporobacter othiniensis]KHS57793.1 hypothetical protein QX51_06430 [Terrisporobacter othiniensis]MDU6983208.1 hypothetical protein [Terrisporobacter othiniensis]